jgi:hypothetical protein
MQVYSIELLIDPEHLQAIKSAKQHIILAKSVSETCTPNVVWQSFEPQADNVVTWSEEYGIYASSTKLVHGARILKTSSTPYPVQDAAAYTFEADATFHGPDHGPIAPGQHQYTIINNVPPSLYPSLAFGLVQSAIINDTLMCTRPLNAQAVPAQQRVTFTPFTSVYIWLQPVLASGTMITHIPHNVAMVSFPSPVNAQMLKYDAQQHRFIPYAVTHQTFLLSARAVGTSPPIF